MKTIAKINKNDLKHGAETLENILLASIAMAGVIGLTVFAPNAIQLLKYFLPEDDMKRKCIK